MNYITSQIMTSIPFLICSSEKDNIVISTYSSSGLSEALMCNMRRVLNVNVREQLIILENFIGIKPEKAAGYNEINTSLVPP